MSGGSSSARPTSIVQAYHCGGFRKLDPTLRPYSFWLVPMIVDRRRILGSFAVLALVFLRLVIGWHFFGEGTKKLQYDRTDGALHLAFSADTELLDKAKGPLADWYFKFVPGGHDWRTLLAVPRENVPPTAEQAAEKAKWLHDYNARRAAAAKKKE